MTRKPRAAQSTFAEEVLRRLKKRFGPVRCPLNYHLPHELCVAVILSAQCTDEQVNRVTPELFRRFPTAADLANAPLAILEELIHSTGFFRNKSRNIQGFCKSLITDHGGVVPRDMDSLLRMPGVGRKTANVLLQELYGIPSGIVVDTHVARLSGVFGLSSAKDPARIERDLMSILPEESWISWSLYMIFLGRSSCTARKRICKGCALADVCPSSTSPSG